MATVPEPSPIEASGYRGQVAGSPDAEPQRQLFKSRRLGRNALLNAAGMGLPLLAAVACIPVLISALGTARFGVLTLIWAVSSYFSLFDFGLGRVLTQQVAAAIELREEDRVGRLVGTSMALLLALGILGGALMSLGADQIAAWIRGQPDAGETAVAVLAMALALPAVTATSGLRGVLEARHEFVAVNAIRLPMGVYTFAGPVAVVMLAGPRLDLIAWVLCAGRWLAVAAHAMAVAWCTPRDSGRLAFDRRLLRPLATSGGWMTLSNVVSPLMGYVDRVLLGTLVSAAAVAYYATPMELVIKLSIVPAALTGVLFPAFSAAMARHEPHASLPVFDRSVLWLLCVLWPLCTGLALFAPELLSMWINRDFASTSAPLLQVFALGILVNCLAHVPFTLLQSAGLARTTALIHLVELPFFLAALWLLITHYGAMGAALAWLLRMGVDTLLMFGASARLLEWRIRHWVRPRNLLIACLCAGGFAGVLLPSLAARAAWLLAISAAAAWLALRSTSSLRPTTLAR